MTESRNENDIGIFWVNGEAADVASVLQTDRVPCLARISALVHAIALQDVVADAGFSSADIDHIWVRFSYRDRSYGRKLFLVRHGNPIQSAVGRLPYATTHSAKVVGIRLAHYARNREHASAPKRADQPPREPLE